MQQLLAGFPATAPGIVIVQHMPPRSRPSLPSGCTMIPRIEIEVAEARQHEPIRAGRALVIPGDIHGLVRRSGTGYRVELVEGPPVCRHRPSVEVLVSFGGAGGRPARGRRHHDRNGGRRRGRSLGNARGRRPDHRPERSDVRRFRHAARGHPPRRGQVCYAARIDRARLSWPGSPAPIRGRGIKIRMQATAIPRSIARVRIACLSSLCDRLA